MTEQRHAALGIHPIETDDPHELVRRRQVVRRTTILVTAILIAMAIGAGRTVMSRMANAKTLESVEPQTIADQREQKKLWKRNVAGR